MGGVLSTKTFESSVRCKVRLKVQFLLGYTIGARISSLRPILNLNLTLKRYVCHHRALILLLDFSPVSQFVVVMGAEFRVRLTRVEGEPINTECVSFRCFGIDEHSFDSQSSRTV